MPSLKDIGKDTRLLLRRCLRASLAVTLPDASNLGPSGSDQGGPGQFNTDQSSYVALVLVAYDMVGRPIMFISNLAEHTKSLKQNPGCSLLLDGTTDLQDPLAGARATLLGEMEFLTGEEAAIAKTRYMYRHPTAKMYQDFPDFNIVRLNPTKAHLVAGFGKIHWLDWSDIAFMGDTAELSESEAEVITHMNTDHSDVVNLMANKLLVRDGVGWQLTGLDPDGCDLRLEGRVIRFDFDSPVYDANAVRKKFVKAAKLSRAA